MWKNKYVIILLSSVLLIIGCQVNDLYHAVDQFEFIVSLVDLANATVEADFDIHWNNLYRISDKYGVDVAGPTANFLVAAQNLQDAYRRLQIAIDAQYQTDIQTQALQRTLHDLEFSQ